MSRIVICTITALLGLSLGVTPVSARTTHGADRGVDQRSDHLVMRPTCSTDSVECRSFARRKARAFRKGRLSNSHGIRMPKRIIRKVRRQARAHPEQFARVRMDDDGVPRWLKAPLNFGKCFVRQVRPDGGLTNTCAEHQADVAAISRRTTRVAVVCGGLVVIGIYFGRKVDAKMAYAAGGAAAECLWQELFAWL